MKEKSSTSSLGINELIERVKQELRVEPATEKMFEIEDITLEVSFIAKKSGEGKIDLQVVQLGGGGESSEIQTLAVKLKFTPDAAKQYRTREGDDVLHG